mmetsp:Transcript_47651/g.142362  ORF Transcript_47651/g.142362 Transcript_47651/m.142362 type:complete len:411 (-) Transcript_47651:120-1352(-)
MPVDSLKLDTSCYMVHGRKFEISRQYSVVEPVGQGMLGVVCVAHDKVADEKCAIKKIECVFEHITSAKRTLRELRILRHLQHENLINVRSIFLPGSKAVFEDIYVISEHMETDLGSIIRSSQPLTHDQTQFLLYQTLRGMKYVHSAGVIHRYVEPRNLLVNSNCDLRICDFGLAQINFEDEGFQTCPMMEYVCTRWYRAPEVLCSWAKYCSAVDVWSIGCVFGEMLVRRPILLGHNSVRQLQLMVRLLGTPSCDELRAIPFKPRLLIASFPRSDGMFEETFSECSKEASKLLRMLLQLSPERRVNVSKALEHPYMDTLFCPEDEPTRDVLDPADFEFERRKVNIQALREELFQEALHYYPETRERYVQEQQRLGKHRYSLQTYPLLVPGEPQHSPDEEAAAEERGRAEPA